MALKINLLFSILLFWFSSPCLSLLVSPGSPCEKSCDTEPGCGTPSSELKQCMNCLQNSTFGSDQTYFRHNVRYSFDYCIFGYNSTQGSNPCSTSEACGHLKSSFLDLNDDNTAYCQPSYSDCMSCVGADPRKYLFNYLVALNASCVDQSTAPLRLNDTLFSPYRISILDPEVPKPKQLVSTPVIIAVSISSFIVLCLVTGCVYLQLHKRKNRRRKGRASSSSLDFRCQTDLVNAQWDASYPEMTKEASFEHVSPLQSHPLTSTPGGLGLQLPVATAVPYPPPPPPPQAPPNQTPSLYSNGSPTNSTTEFVTPKVTYSTTPKNTSPVQKQSAWMRAPRGAGAPVESTQLQTSYPPPPRR